MSVCSVPYWHAVNCWTKKVTQTYWRTLHVLLCQCNYFFKFFSKLKFIPWAWQRQSLLAGQSLKIFGLRCCWFPAGRQVFLPTDFHPASRVTGNTFAGGLPCRPPPASNKWRQKSPPPWTGTPQRRVVDARGAKVLRCHSERNSA